MRSYYKAIILVFIGVILLWSCNSQKSIPQKNVTFKLEATYGAESTPAQALLASVGGMAVDNKKNIYLTERGSRVLSFKDDGTLRWVLDKKGSGPGDISWVSGITTDGDKYLYLSNQRGSRLDKYNLDGEFIESYNLSDLKTDFLSLIGYIKPGFLIGTGAAMGNIAADVIVFEINNGIKIKTSFTVDRSNGLKVSKGVGLGVDINTSSQYITAGNCNEYKLDIFDLNGKNIQSIYRKDKKIITAYVFSSGGGEAGSISAPWIINNTYYLCASAYPKGINTVEELADHKGKFEFAHLLDLFDKEGNLVYSKQGAGFADEEIGRVLFVDSEDKIYTYREKPYPQVCRFKLIIEDKK